MKRFGLKRIALLLFILQLFFILGGTSVFASEIGEASDKVLSEEYFCTQAGVSNKSADIKISSRFYELLFNKLKDKNQRLYLIPGGDVFGIRIKEKEVTVSSAKDNSALKRGDKILSVSGTEIKEAADIEKALEGYKGGAVNIDIIRGGEKMTVTVIPKYEGGAYKLGITLKRAACGIGTVSFIDPQTGAFGGLGHGVCDSESGNLVELSAGEATGVILGGVTRGEIGKPGELSGVLNKKCIGSIDKNSECGVFGVFDNYNVDDATPLPVAKKKEIKLGEAEIISTVKGGKKSSYKIEITEIDINSTGSKSFKIKVTDPMLIALTGGIVRGMSGSPIIQNGKIVGAVTHVMIAEPTEGYGIFIENMLNAAKSEIQTKAA
ncbi:MAG: PDZ domain-containing protein [Ruminococcaceae bacterium]|nr:PDZ domain-containing protein [Oscillospiraceae bacterium]